MKNRRDCYKRGARTESD